MAWCKPSAWDSTCSDGHVSKGVSSQRIVRTNKTNISCSEMHSDLLVCHVYKGLPCRGSSDVRHAAVQMFRVVGSTRALKNLQVKMPMDVFWCQCALNDAISQPALLPWEPTGLHTLGSGDCSA